MNPRFATGTGDTPVYLYSINRERTGRGVLVFSGGTLGTRNVIFQSNLELHAMLNVLLRQSVPLSIGGHMAGPADEVAMRIQSGKLRAPYIEISWSAPKHWTVREMVEGALEWQPVAHADAFATFNFDPDSLNQGKSQTD